MNEVAQYSFTADRNKLKMYTINCLEQHIKHTWGLDYKSKEIKWNTN